MDPGDLQSELERLRNKKATREKEEKDKAELKALKESEEPSLLGKFFKKVGKEIKDAIK